MAEWVWCECVSIMRISKETQEPEVIQIFAFLKKILRKHGRVVEGNSLENCHGETHREFESHCFLINIKAKEIQRAQVECKKYKHSACRAQTASQSK